ncbi:MAG: N-acetyltransferase [Gemmatimonadota bacterium]|nr:MAG: N-acetyltransferase [Gemmatimonadota bacterium]
MRITTERLVLRKPSLPDAPAVYRLANDRRVTRWMTLPWPYRPEDAVQFVRMSQREFRKGIGQHFVIERRGDGELLGSVGLMDHRPTHRRAEVGYWLGSEHWKQGYASEALGGVLRLAFRDMQLNRVHAVTFPENEASGAVLLRAGFQREGQHRRHWKHRARWHDLVIWGLLRNEWDGRQKEG